MNAKEAMQALLDGKTLKCEYVDVRYKLDDEGNLLYINRTGQNVLKNWTLADLEIYDEYPLTFEQALRAMLDGKTVMRKSSDEHRYRIHNGTFESSTERGDFTDWELCTIFANTQKAKWKVVE